jgi:hypothetical protein
MCSPFLTRQCAERAFNKLARTFALQVEALKRYRGKGEQKMTVEHTAQTFSHGSTARMTETIPSKIRAGLTLVKRKAPNL